jgi:hypothetical protein
MPKKVVKKAVKETAQDAIKHITKHDSEREERIRNEYIVDTYNDPQDRAMGWYYSLSDAIFGKVRCRCFKERSMSPLAVGDKIDIIGMPPESDCMREMFVYVHWNDRRIAVPLNQLEPLDDDEAGQVIEDWLYWCLMGYEF